MLVNSTSNNSTARLGALDWQEIEAGLNNDGHALTGVILKPDQCDAFIRMYDDQDRFRSRVVMARHNFGRGEYKYFAEPLPQLVSELRQAFYDPLSRIANRWAQRLIQRERFPSTYDEFVEICRRKSQTLPTPLMLRYEAGDYNCLHQDLYGEVAFPLQTACVLSNRGEYSGGEFLLTEQRPRMQTRGEAITIEQGEFIIFPNRWRPVGGSRGDYRVNVRHGVSRLRTGRRYSLGLIFHLSK